MDRIIRVQELGYNEEESRFLGVAALHSGYFLRRQFLSFTGASKGSKDVAFLEKLSAKGQCRMSVYRHNRAVYHLCSKPLYNALGDSENRNRREHQPSTIKNKIMALDVVLAGTSGLFLATEREKTDYFIGVCGVARQDLPTRLYASPHGAKPNPKVFADGYPISIPEPGQGPVHFFYIDEGLQTTDRYSTFLRHYERLLRALTDFRLVYVAETSRLFASAGRVFQNFMEVLYSESAGADAVDGNLLAYFKKRHAYEARDFTQFDTEALIRFREEKARFASAAYEALYEWWSRRNTIRYGSERSASECFATLALSHDYDLFGNLTKRGGKPSRTQIPTELEKSGGTPLEDEPATCTNARAEPVPNTEPWR